MFHILVGILLALITLIFFGMMLFAIVGPEISYHPMPHDEEVKWLMEQGLSKEEAEEIAGMK